MFVGDFAAQHRKPLGVSVIENLDYLRLLVRHSEVTLIDDERATHRIEDAKERRDGRGTGCEYGFVADRADDLQEPGLTAAQVATCP